VLRDNRGWTPPEWDDGQRRLERRGLIGADGAATEPGQALRRSVEAMTDDLAETAFAELGRACCPSPTRWGCPSSKWLSRLFPQRDHGIGDWVSRRIRCRL
jgi:hypothetical protein